ncbi:hypothetical protein KIPB_007883, partial [Kipferlia bialata]
EPVAVALELLQYRQWKGPSNGKGPNKQILAWQPVESAVQLGRLAVLRFPTSTATHVRGGLVGEHIPGADLTLEIQEADPVKPGGLGRVFSEKVMGVRIRGDDLHCLCDGRLHGPFSEIETNLDKANNWGLLTM